MRKPLEPGIHAYLGEPKTGKTYRAMADLAELSKRHGWRGAIVVDSTGAENWVKEPHAPSVAHAIATACAGEVAYWTPRRPDAQEQVDNLMRGLLAARDPNLAPPLVVDEFQFWRIDKRSDWMALCRTWRHHCHSIFLTSQSVSTDMTETFEALRPKLHVFRSIVPKRYWPALLVRGINPQRVGELPDREFIDA
jgi:hypothetical protein